MTLLLGVDLGERRIGLAVADDAAGPARPFATIRRSADPSEDAAAIRRALGGQVVGELVVGLPLDMRDGTEGPQAIASRQWAEAAASELRLPLTLRDERLSSHLAEERVGRIGRGRSGGPPTPHQREAYRARIDREAAAIILQDELDARLGSRPPAVATNVDSAGVAAPTSRRSRKEQA